jgi:hypothetical protein
MKRFAIAAALLVLGCGGKTKEAETAAPKHAPAPRPSRAAHSGALFVVDFEALLPVACYDERTKKWDSGEKCIDLLPDDATVQLESGRIVKPSGHRIPDGITGCTLTTPLLMFEDAASEKPGSFAVWPSKAEGRVKRIDWSSTKGGAAGFPEKDRPRLARALTQIGSSDPVQIVQAASADLDADGTSETLYSINGVGFDPATRKGKAALLLSHGMADEMFPIRSSDHAVFRVEGIVDVDDDGIGEVWFSERTFHPNGQRTDTMVLAWHAPGGLTPLTPMESCWPPSKAK